MQSWRMTMVRYNFIYNDCDPWSLPRPVAHVVRPDCGWQIWRAGVSNV